MSRTRSITRTMLAAALVAATTHAAPPAGDVVAVRAGTLHLVDGGGGPEGAADRVVTGGGTVVVRDGKIVAVGADDEVAVPPGARVVDYGPDAVIVPGLVAADSRYGSDAPSDRTADPTLRAVDNFDRYSELHTALARGVTTVYLAPARRRLVAGQGAVVKTGGHRDGGDGAVVLAPASIHGSISSEARNTPGYWQPPVPATVDVGLGVPQPQLPRTTMGAVVALEELLALAGGDDSLADEYGPRTGPGLASLMEAGVPWRLGAEARTEVRALLEFFDGREQTLVVDGASGAADLADELAARGVMVVARPPYESGRDFGKGENADWPEYGAIARLVEAGVTVAVAAPQRVDSGELQFAAGLAMRGGMPAERALRTITSDAARVLGVDDRVGSLEVGKDADLCVFNDAPLESTAGVVATWVDGELAWKVDSENASTVISVDELHLGDGHVLSPGEVLVRGGRIAAVARDVGRPPGAVVVRGAAAMPGMIDAFGHLGLSGSNRAFSTRDDSTRILGPGDRVDREVARRGVTTVHLASRQTSGAVTPTVAYKPAASEFDGLVVDPVAAVRMTWTAPIVAQSGEQVRKTLAEAKEYVDEWAKYEAEMAEWEPPAAEEEDDDEDDEEEEEEEEDGDEDEDDEERGKGDREPARPVTGVWEGTVTLTDADEPGSARYRFLEHEDGDIEGSVRVSFHEDLMPLEGERDGYDVTLRVQAPPGEVVVQLAQAFSNDPEDGEKRRKKKDDDEPVEVFLRGDVTFEDQVIASVDVKQTSTEYEVARRPQRLPEEEERERDPKGKPKEPSIDDELEPLRRAMNGEAAVLVTVNREDQILDCVDAFEEVGIRPILFGANEAHEVADRIRGRVAGVLLSRSLTASGPNGLRRNRYAELSAAGIPVAFHSSAEEGAAELAAFAARAIAEGMGGDAVVRSLTSDAAAMLAIDDRVGTIAVGKDADIVLLDGSPTSIGSSVQRVWVNGEEVR